MRWIMRIKMPDFVDAKLAPKGSGEARWRKILRRITCTIEGHPTASWDNPTTNILTCDWCGWKKNKKR